MKIGIYSIAYLGVWYKGAAMDLAEFIRFAKKEGWEGIELDTKRPHAAPMDLSADRRKELRDLAGELGMPISAVSPNCDLSSPVPEHREAMICYVRECIKLTKDLGSPLCKIFAAWKGVATRDGLADYEYTKGDPYPDWAADRWGFVRESLKELAKYAGDQGVTLALQNHGPVIRNYKDVLAFIAEVGSPALKACMDIPMEDKPDSPERARAIVAETGPLLVHSHFGGEFRRDQTGGVELHWDHGVAYAEYVAALVKAGYSGFINWEYCHPAMADGKRQGIEHVHAQGALAHEFMKKLRTAAAGPA
jgi:sugar phosphate isomerase/epimerase